MLSVNLYFHEITKDTQLPHWYKRPGCLYQQDGHSVIDIIFLLFPLDKGHVLENLW